MAGHSKWHSIRHKKAANDAKMGKIFTKHAKLITIAARDGGGDPDSNATLRTAIQNAKAANMPNTNIDRAIKKGTGEGGEAVNMVELFYEGFGPAGIALYVHAITDNKNRSYTNIRTTMNKNGGNMGEAGSVGWMFERKGQVTVILDGRDPEEAQLELIDTGAEDFAEAGEEMLVYCTDSQTQTVAEAIEGLGYKVKSKELTFLPKQTVAIDEQNVADKLFKLIDALEDDDDVQTVYMNAELGESIQG